VAPAASAGERGYDVGDLVPGLASARPARPAPMPGLHPSVVVIRAGSAAGLGFYVRKDMVLTTQELVGVTSVVDVTTAAGATVPALVAAIDPARGLALLQVPQPGPAVILDDGRASAATLPDAGLGPGHPLFAGERVIGMTAAAGQDVITIEAIRGFLDGQAGVLAAIP